MRGDVLVAGGGSAGIAAAVAAARAGAQVVLIERAGSLGGMASLALVHSICGLYLLGKEPAQFANPGFSSEFASRLLAAGGASGPVKMGRVEVLLQHPTAFATLADEMVAAEKNIELRLHTELLAPDEIFCRGVREKIEAAMIIDATGDAALAALCGAECEMESLDRLQRPAFIFALGGVETGALDDDARLRVAHAIVGAVRDGNLPEAALGASLRASPRAGEAFVSVDLAAPGFDPLDPRSLARIEIEGRKLAQSMTLFLTKCSSGFSSAHLSALPARAGIRESRRIIGEHRLETDDLLAGARFDDAIALATWPIELREQARGARLRFPENGEPCEIPLRALRARGRANLFAAGRCIAASHEAQASIRVMGTCFATGEAAGLAAARVADRGTCTAGEIAEMRAQFFGGARSPREHYSPA